MMKSEQSKLYPHFCFALDCGKTAEGSSIVLLGKQKITFKILINCIDIDILKRMSNVFFYFGSSQMAYKGRPRT